MPHEAGLQFLNEKPHDNPFMKLLESDDDFAENCLPRFEHSKN